MLFQWLSDIPPALVGSWAPRDVTNHPAVEPSILTPGRGKLFCVPTSMKQAFSPPGGRRV